MLDLAHVDLEEFDARKGRILEIRTGQQGVTEVIPLLVHPLLLRILSSAHLHNFLRSVEIMQESSYGDRGDRCYTPRGCGYLEDM